MPPNLFKKFLVEQRILAPALVTFILCYFFPGIFSNLVNSVAAVQSIILSGSTSSTSSSSSGVTYIWQTLPFVSIPGKQTNTSSKAKRIGEGCGTCRLCTYNFKGRGWLMYRLRNELCTPRKLVPLTHIHSNPPTPRYHSRSFD